MFESAALPSITLNPRLLQITSLQTNLPATEAAAAEKLQEEFSATLQTLQTELAARRTAEELVSSCEAALQQLQASIAGVGSKEFPAARSGEESEQQLVEHQEKLTFMAFGSDKAHFSKIFLLRFLLKKIWTYRKLN